MNLKTEVSQIKGVGPALTQSLNQSGIYTVYDLLMYFPRAYDDYSNVLSIAKVRPGPVTLKAKFSNIDAKYRRGGLHVTSATAEDQSGAVKITWFNQPYRKQSLKSDTEYYVSGELDMKYRQYQLINPSVELVSDLPKHTARILARYPEKKSLKSSQIRKLIPQIINLADEIEDLIPKTILNQEGLKPKSQAIRQLHMPDSQEKLEMAKDRIGFEEVFELQLAALVSKQQSKGFNAPKLPFDVNATKQYLSKLDFKLTDGQRKAAWQILQDISKESPMNRMLQGDVGSGKTVVAGMAIEQCLRAGKQAAFMAPTEVLAQQHRQTLRKLFADESMALITSSTNPSEKRQIYSQMESGSALVFIGTHALIQDSVRFSDLGLAIVDEQHRFGVEQRQKLLRGKQTPHLLSMTATPIPRSLALTVYGDLDISTIDELPKGRKPVKTKVMPFTSVQEVDKKVEDEVKKDRQVYIVCPLIEESETLELKNVEEEYRRVKQIHKRARVGLLHGKLSSEVKQKVLNDFKNKRLDIIVSTTVIEVGVDVPGASLIVIEGAERFGLSQLHQLRGRVGRSDIDSTCILVTSPGVKPSTRLRAMEHTTSGFKLADIDMKIRGPGAVYGTRQHGALDLRMANINDTQKIAHIRNVAKNFLDSQPDMLQYPALFSRIKELRNLTRLN